MTPLLLILECGGWTPLWIGTRSVQAIQSGVQPPHSKSVVTLHLAWGLHRGEQSFWVKGHGPRFVCCSSETPPVAGPCGRGGRLGSARHRRLPAGPALARRPHRAARAAARPGTGARAHPHALLSRILRPAGRPEKPRFLVRAAGAWRDQP